MEFDPSQPNAGRIYDYLLGGSHNFAVDRMAAERLVQMIPTIENGARLNRWFLDIAVNRLADLGFNRYLDLASGLPTQGYIHEIRPDALVLYNDYDQATVAYAREIIGNNPRVIYHQANIAELESILAQAEQHFAGERKLAICMIGVSYFLNDQVLSQTLQRLYEWCAPGSQIAISWIALPENPNPKLQELLARYSAMGSPIYARTVEQIKQFIAPWTLLEPGFQRLSEWNEIDGTWVIDGDRQEGDEQSDMYGTFMIKG
ncbi:SAM-dependent methyltransferase [Herpetosiphon sp.]|uniref:S-adenosyl methyltransferase n=1 Tax=Herpetosiphon aurantiacus (strain ATCC 23779 / DSM 785 / 114-95) TaxID=316274 RepID=A9B4G2_HERA2|nr:SAM-dependent methyltransferase [Herpetosiphon sp.]ABX02719.1 protein of unknown function DUF574 [Herpetosiphon aurantiacus DSM 785]